jgi:hypothetical protein
LRLASSSGPDTNCAPGKFPCHPRSCARSEVHCPGLLEGGHPAKEAGDRQHCQNDPRRECGAVRTCRWKCGFPSGGQRNGIRDPEAARNSTPAMPMRIAQREKERATVFAQTRSIDSTEAGDAGQNLLVDFWKPFHPKAKFNGTGKIKWPPRDGADESCRL